MLYVDRAIGQFQKLLALISDHGSKRWSYWTLG